MHLFLYIKFQVYWPPLRYINNDLVSYFILLPYKIFINACNHFINHGNKKAMVIDEFSRIGGGQVFANILINFLVKNQYQTFVESDRYATYLNAENIIKLHINTMKIYHF